MTSPACIECMGTFTSYASVGMSVQKQATLGNKGCTKLYMYCALGWWFSGSVLSSCPFLCERVGIGGLSACERVAIVAAL